MELNAETVKKALECCKTPSASDCETCSYAGKVENGVYTGCVNLLVGDALSLIKELTEDVERVAKQCGEIIVECDERDAERLMQVAKLTEENERLRGELTGANKDKQILFDEIASLEAEAEKAIDIAEGNIRAEIASCGTSCHWCEDKVKADTVRKMHSEIKERCIKGGIYPAFVASTIDQIAKEMLEGSDG